ncbi:MAG: hypothetical protein IJJ11_08635 [Methanosphaera sp.]|nr:hypothetical protein [Methanosphaera sp.]
MSQSIVIFILSMILFVIAAPIETYISVPFSELQFGNYRQTYQIQIS